MSAPTRGTLGRLVAAACVVALGVACSTLPSPQVELPSGRSFVPMVADSVDDVGLDPSITVDGEGIPYLSYFGFTAELSPDEIPVSRPIGSPYLGTEAGDPAGAVLLTSLAPDSQVWIRGAAAQPRESPSGITVPFGPAAVPSLASLTLANAGGTDVELAGAEIHVVWSAASGVWYGLGPNFEIEPIERGAGMGDPSIAIAEDGTPIIAYTVAGTQPQVRVAERTGDSWTTTTVATLPQCGRDCPPPTSVGVVGGEPLVVVADPASREVVAARRSGAAWSTEVVATGVAGGVSLAAASEGATVAYYTPGGVAVATAAATGGWSSEEVASVTPSEEASPSPSSSPTTGTSPSPAEGDSPSPAAAEPIETEPRTGVALDGDGRVWVTWEDAEGVHLASSADGGSFEEADLGRTDGGVTPSVAATEDGSSVYLTWFDPASADLFVGIYAELDELLLAAPSPTTAPPAGGGDDTCGQDGELILDVVAENTAFTPDCLVAAAGQPFSINFENRDPVGSTGPHNVAIGTDATTVAESPIFSGDLVDGPDQTVYDVPAIDEAGTYLFRCDIHPTMTGTLAVIDAGQGGGGGGGQGGGADGGSGSGGDGGGGGG